MELKDTLLALGLCTGIIGSSWVVSGSPFQDSRKTENKPVVSSPASYSPSESYSSKNSELVGKTGNLDGLVESSSADSRTPEGIPTPAPLQERVVERIVEKPVVNNVIHNHYANACRPMTCTPVIARPVVRPVFRPVVVARPLVYAPAYFPATCRPATCSPGYIYPRPVRNTLRWIFTGHYFRWDDARNRHNW